jgi:hypothetical protein
MAAIILTSPVSETTEFFARALGDLGFSVHATADAVAAVRAVAIGRGRVDAVVFLDEGGLIHLASPNPYPRYEAQVTAENIIAAIRGLPDNLSFGGAVRARATAIHVATNGGALAIEDRWVTTSTLPGPRNAGVMYVANKIMQAIQEWRRDLLTELEYVGYVVSMDAMGHYHVDHALSRKRRESELLTDEASPGALRHNQYLILAADMLAGFTPYFELTALLKTYEQVARQRRVKPETIFQEFFEKHPQMIYRSEFARHFAKPALSDPQSGRLIQPDFVLQPHVAPSLAPWEILDLKLPKVPLVSNRRFHPKFSENVNHAIQQLRDYRREFERPDMKDQLFQRFGAYPVNPRTAVLIGRRRDDDMEALERLQRDTLDVRLLTYDDVLDFELSRLWLRGSIAGLFDD